MELEHSLLGVSSCTKDDVKEISLRNVDAWKCGLQSKVHPIDSPNEVANTTTLDIWDDAAKELQEKQRQEAERKEEVCLCTTFTFMSSNIAFSIHWFHLYMKLVLLIQY
jgi:hypothetical protein